MEAITIGDIEICYELKGEGYPLVMIMGLTANIDWWPPEMVRVLSERYRLLLFDNRGAGRSSASGKRFSIKQFACDAVSLMDTLGIVRAHVLGVSMGGMIAQELVLGFPYKVDRLILGCTFCGGTRAVRPNMSTVKKLAVRAKTPEDQARISIPLLFTEDWLAEYPGLVDEYAKTISIAPAKPRNAMRQLAAIAGFSTYRRLPRIDCPTLVCCGSEDILVPPRNSSIIANRIPGAELREFEGAGHGFITQRCADVTSGFLGFLSA
jgi:pimeloyl-ACP methyl ester carboxylesterase